MWSCSCNKKAHIRIMKRIGLSMIIAFVMIMISTKIEIDYEIKLVQLINHVSDFHLHSNAHDFIHNFYTQNSVQNLRDTRNYVFARREHSNDDYDDLYLLLQTAIDDLEPIMIRRGQATSIGEDLNFRSTPAVATQVLHRLPYGTHFEIIADVSGGNIVSEDGSENNIWHRVRVGEVIGYVSSRYVRNFYISSSRTRKIAEIGLAELWIHSLIEGWNTNYSPNTIRQLELLLQNASHFKINNWQFDMSYNELFELLLSLDTSYIEFVTLRHYELTIEIENLLKRFNSYISGDGYRFEEDFTTESWSRMTEVVNRINEIIIQNWQVEFTEIELEMILYELNQVLTELEKLVPADEILEISNINSTPFEDELRNFQVGVLIVGAIFVFFIGFRIIRRIFD